ncbi:MAG: hypothetical protein AAFR59_04450 [Bacteroidota bacterium]
MYRLFVLAFVVLLLGVQEVRLVHAVPPQTAHSSTARDELQRLWDLSQGEYPTDTTLYYLKQSQPLWSQVPKDELYFRVVIRMSRIQMLKDEIEGAIVNLERLLKEIIDVEGEWQKIYEGLIYTYLGYAYLEINEWPQAFKHGSHAMRIFEKQAPLTYQAEAWNLLGYVYSNLDQPALAKKYFLNVASIDTQKLQPPLLGKSLYGLGICYQKLNRQDSAIHFLKIASAKGVEVDDPILELSSQLAIAQSAFWQREKQIAIGYATEVLQKAQVQGASKQEFRAHCLLTQFYTQMKDYRKAFQAAEATLSFDRALGTPENWKDIFQALGMIYLYRSEVDSSRKYLELSEELRNVAHTSHDYMTTQRLEVAYINENLASLQAANRNQANYISRQRFILTVCGGVMVFGFLITLAMAYTNRERRKTNKILQEQNDAIKSQKEEIQRLNQGLEKIVAQRTRQLASQNRELEEYAYLHSHKVRAPLANILGLVEIIQGQPTDAHPELVHLISKLNKVSNQLDGAIREINDAIERQVADPPPTSIASWPNGFHQDDIVPPKSSR